MWRFIPAGAGNTTQLKGSGMLESVYPRWRGEHGAVLDIRPPGLGLSPLARGTLRRYGPYIYNARFIPAGAGNTARFQRRQSTRTVYPRWRGEHFIPDASLMNVTGLSPLARGTRATSCAGLPRCWFIPAGAGNTRDILRGIAPVLVYPRWRGEHTPVVTVKAGIIGLSPLARGTLNNKSMTY